MNVLLVYSLGNYATVREPLPQQESIHFGLSYVAAVLEQHGHRVRVVVMTRETPLVTFDEQVRDHAPGLLGFTAVGQGMAWSRQAELTRLPLSPSMRLDDAVHAVSSLPFGGTDCALPMLYALERRLPVDAFVVYTDNETWAGMIHPVQALRQYRERTGIAAKLVVVGLVSNGFSIADPNDAGMLDVVGFDTYSGSQSSAARIAIDGGPCPRSLQRT